MKKILSVENMRNSDAATIAAGIPGRELMYRAGSGIYDVLIERGIISKRSGDSKEEYCVIDGKNIRHEVLIVCGSGNNAGDGFVVANLLKENNISCTVYLASPKFSDDGKYYYDKCVQNDVKIVNITQEPEYIKNLIQNINTGEVNTSEKSIDGVDSNIANTEATYATKYVILDCLLGTGFKGTPREPIKTVINDINNLKEKHSDMVTIVSVDINSGLNGDNGLCDICVKSDYTVSIGDFKSGLFLNKAKDVIGEAINIDIGIVPQDRPFYLMETIDVAHCIPKRLNDSNKGTYGYIALIGGSAKYSGAIRLATMANAAMRSGAGVVLVAAPTSISEYIVPNILESTFYPLSDEAGEVIFNQSEIDTLMKRVRVIAFGMGIGHTDETEKMLSYILTHYEGILIIDADGLNCLASIESNILKETTCRRVIITPHIKEFSRLTGEEISAIREDSIRLASSYSGQNHVITLLKGPTTIVSDGKNILFVNKGCPGMATAGSGDVLSGILAATCGYMTTPDNDYIMTLQGHTESLSETDNELWAVASGAYINGLAGELAQEEFGAVSMIASDTVNMLPKAIKLCT